MTNIEKIRWRRAMKAKHRRRLAAMRLAWFNFEFAILDATMAIEDFKQAYTASLGKHE